MKVHERVLVRAAVRTVDLVAARAATKSQRNRLLAAALRSKGLAANGETWTAAKDALAARLSQPAAAPVAAVVASRPARAVRMLVCRDCGRRVVAGSHNATRCHQCAEVASAAFAQRMYGWK